MNVKENLSFVGSVVLLKSMELLIYFYRVITIGNYIKYQKSDDSAKISKNICSSKANISKRISLKENNKTFQMHLLELPQRI